MAASLSRAQYALKLCVKHDKKELQAFCKTCVEKICSSCIKEEHNSHDWELITDIIREKKRSLPVVCQEIRTKQLPGLRDDICRFDRKIEEEETRLQQNKSVLNDSRKGYITRVNQLFDDRIDECEQKSEAAMQIYKDKRDALKQKVEFLDMMSTALDKDIDILPDHDILDMEKEMRDELEKALTYSSVKYTSTALIVPGQMNEQAFEAMIADKFFSINEEYDIDKYSEIVTSLETISDTNAYVMIGRSRIANAKLIGRTGVELKTIKTPCHDFAVLNNGMLVLTEDKKCIILVLTQDEDKIRTIDTKPLRPTFISKTENDDILVTLMDDGDQYNLTPTSHRVVKRMTLTGKVLQTYEFMEDGKTRLFTTPVRKAENKNSDVCVINRYNADEGELVVLHKDGRVKFSYHGDRLAYEKFLPYDVECDSKCHILLTEKYSRAIHVLNAEGMFLRTLYQPHLRPFVISLHVSNLWCGFVEGRVKVFEYKN